MSRSGARVLGRTAPTPRVAILSPALDAVSGVSTHANMLLDSALGQHFDLVHFQVGSEGRDESRLRRGFRTAFSPFRLAGFILSHRPQVVHINTSMDRKAYWRDLAHLYVAKSLGVKVLSQVHGGVLPQELFAGRPMLSRLLRASLRRSDVVAVLSMQEQAAYSAFCPQARIVRITNAIAADALQIQHRPDKPLALDHPLRLVYIGRLIREKGVFDVLEAVVLLRAAGRSVEFDIAGSGAAEDTLVARVRELGLDAQVHFHGAISGDRKWRLWQQADVFAFPTYHPEGLPYALLEAMSAGTPAITCAVAAIPDVMQHEVHGLFVAPRDPQVLAQAIATLDEDRLMLAQMATACRSQVQDNFTVERLAGDFASLYTQLLCQGV